TAMVKSGEVSYDLFVYGNLFVIDVVNWNYYLPTSSVNRAMMNNSKVLEAIDKIKTSSDDAVRTEQLKVMQTEAHEKVSYIPICWKVNNYAYTNGLEGFEVSAMPTYNFRNVCLRTN
ncbi:MAG: hypothetical protein IKM51_02560, partial [Oscillospiraceae bacterium]|nr:hypothetical protein [Oscillospiraceae bacterium]